MNKHPGYMVAAAATWMLLSPVAARAQAPDPSAAPPQAPAPRPGTAGVAPPPPAFEAPTFPAPAYQPPAFEPVDPVSGEPLPDAELPDEERAILKQAARYSVPAVQVDGNAMYRRLYGADISGFQLGLTVGKVVGRSQRLLVSGFALGSIGWTNGGLQTRAVSLGSELAFPLSRWSTGFGGRFTPAFRPHLTYMDIERITTTRHFFGVGIGLDAQIGVDLVRTGRHAIYAVGRVGIEGFIGDGPDLLDLTSFWMWGGSLGLGFRY